MPKISWLSLLLSTTHTGVEWSKRSEVKVQASVQAHTSVAQTWLSFILGYGEAKHRSDWVFVHAGGVQEQVRNWRCRWGSDNFIVSYILCIQACEFCRDVEVEIHVQVLLQTGTGIIECAGTGTAVHRGAGFGSSRRICEETMCAWCGLLIAKTLLDCLPLYLLCPAVIWRRTE